MEGVLAANIFDWGSRACVDLYHKGTIIEIYRMSRKKMRRPWRVYSVICLIYFNLYTLFLFNLLSPSLMSTHFLNFLLSQCALIYFIYK